MVLAKRKCWSGRRCFILLATVVCGMAAKPPVGLRVERLINPAAIREPKPRLSWELSSAGFQSAYQIQAAASIGNLLEHKNLTWDSGKVETNDTLNGAVYPESLVADQQVFWVVRVWYTTTPGIPSPWSSTSFFRMGRTKESDWTGTWITRQSLKNHSVKYQDTNQNYHDCRNSAYGDHPNTIFQRNFTTFSSKTVRQATLYISGLGYYTLALDGKPFPGDTFLDPAFTSYNRRVMYATLDVTKKLTTEKKDHVIRISLGNGWFNPLPLLMWGKTNIRSYLSVSNHTVVKMDLVIEYNDGTYQVIATSKEQLNLWRTTNGPWLKNDIYLGTKFDQQRSNDLQTGLPKTQWGAAILANEIIAQKIGHTLPQLIPPIRSISRLVGRQVNVLASGATVWDMGQNFAGTLNITFTGPLASGVEIEFKYGEILWPNGSVNVMTSVAGQIKHPGIGGPCAPDVAFQRDVYISDNIEDGRTVSFVPRFTWHGFRYVEVSSSSVRRIDGIVLRTDVETVSDFKVISSNNKSHIFDNIWTIVKNTHDSNMMSIQSDCPHRERFGYGGDMLATAETSFHLYDMSQFYRKRVEDYSDAQRADGSFTETAPYVGLHVSGVIAGDGSGPIGWDSVQPILQYWLYTYYGDKRTLETFYESTKRWISVLENVSIRRLETGLSDWMNVETTGNVRALTGHIFLWRNYDAWSKINDVLNHTAVAEIYRKKAKNVAESLNAKFLARDGTYKGGEFNLTQCGQSMPLYFGLEPSYVPSKLIISKMIESLMESSSHRPQMRTGMFCIKPLLFSLSEKASRLDLAYEMLSRSDFPSYGYMLANNATTIWESWFFSNNTYSHNHPMFSSVSVWFIKVLGGIRQWPTSVAYSTIHLKPRSPGFIDKQFLGVNATLNTLRGRIDSNWTAISDESNACTCNWRFKVPYGTTAYVDLPGRKITSVGGGLHELRGIKLCNEH